MIQQTALTLSLTALVNFCSVGDAVAQSPPSADVHGFVANAGQWRDAVQFSSRFAGMDVRGVEAGLSLALRAGERSHVIGLRIDGGDPAATWRGENPAAVRVQFASGDRGTRTPAVYRRMTLPRVRDGVDLVVYESGGGVEYDVLLAPGADPSALRIEVLGASGLRIDDGCLVIDTPAGAVRQSRPRTFTVDADGQRHPIASTCVLRGATHFGFEIPGWDGEDPLVVDPIVYATLYGGSFEDLPQDVGQLSDGSVVVTGRTTSQDLPVTPGRFSAAGRQDAFFARLSADGTTLLAATYLGGAGDEQNMQLVVTEDDRVHISGTTTSSDYPTTPGALQTMIDSAPDAFVTRLDGLTGALLWSTYLGGQGPDVVSAAHRVPGATVLVGTTGSSNFPTTPGAYQTTIGAGGSAFVCLLADDGATLDRSTFFGVGLPPTLFTVDAATDGTIVFGGLGLAGSPRTSNTLPIGPPPPASFGTGYVASLSADLSQLTYGTFIGGGGASDIVTSVTATAAGTIVVGGRSGPGLPTTPGAISASSGGAYVAEIAATGSSFDFATFLGNSSSTLDSAVVLADRSIVVIGRGGVATTPGAFQTTGGPIYVAQVSPTGDALRYSTRFGDVIPFSGMSIDAVDDGSVVIAGSFNRIFGGGTVPTTPGAFRPDTGASDAGEGFVARLDLLPTGVTRYGGASRGCTGRPAISVSGIPTTGSTDFAIEASGGEPGLPAFLVLTAAPRTSPLAVFGVEVWVDLGSALLTTAVPVDAEGRARYPLPIRADPGLVGATLYSQFLFLNPPGPAPCPVDRLSATAGLEFVVQ